jgi:hypothetical protein
MGEALITRDKHDEDILMRTQTGGGSEFVNYQFLVMGKMECRVNKKRDFS